MLKARISTSSPTVEMVIHLTVNFELIWYVVIAPFFWARFDTSSPYFSRPKCGELIFNIFVHQTKVNGLSSRCCTSFCTKSLKSEVNEVTCLKARRSFKMLSLSSCSFSQFWYFYLAVTFGIETLHHYPSAGFEAQWTFGHDWFWEWLSYSQTYFTGCAFVVWIELELQHVWPHRLSYPSCYPTDLSFRAGSRQRFFITDALVSWSGNMWD